jgi:UDP-N-acetylglucosamine transferase subunit ALG13
VTAYHQPLVFVTVGGDHHPFARLMSWVEDWLVDQGDRVRCIVQHGPATPPAGAEAMPYLDHRDLIEHMTNARAVVSSGGPTTLGEARHLGHRPVAVPRLASLGEHVDDHQRVFTARLQDLGYVVRVETEPDFRSALEAALTAPRVMPTVSKAAQLAAVTRVGTLIDLAAQERRGGLYTPRSRPPALRRTSQLHE